MESTAKANLQGLRVVSFESRRAKEMAELIRRYGGDPIVAPSMREIPLSENRAALDLLPQLEAGKFDLLILMTGVGTRTLNEALLTRFPQERITAALRRTTLLARGPKPVAALKELGLEPAFTAPEPNTWREVLTTLSSKLNLRGKRIAVQEYGIPNPQLVAALESLGATVASIPIYRWALPEDLGPLRAAIQKILRAEADVALFTNGAQVDHLFQVAADDPSARAPTLAGGSRSGFRPTGVVEGATGLPVGLHKADAGLRIGLQKIVVASVGPVCTQVLEQFGLKPDLEPAHPKMGSLIAEVAASAQRILAAKRAV